MRKVAMIAAAVAVLGISGTAEADNVMKVCGAKYQAAKAAKTLPAGQTWNQFLAQCRGAPTAAAPAVKPVAAATPVAPKPMAAAPVPAAPAAKGAPSAAMAAMHDRQRKCGQMWSADKAAGKIPAGQTWPKYWSACNTKLKG